MSKAKKKLHIIMAIYFLAIYIFIACPPIVTLIDRIEPHIFIFPFSQFCILFASLGIAIGLIILYLIEAHIDKIEDAEYEKEVETHAY